MYYFTRKRVILAEVGTLSGE